MHPAAQRFSWSPGEDIGLEADDEASPEHDDGNAGEKAKHGLHDGLYVLTRLRLQDGEEEGNCKSESDRTILKKPDVPEELEAWQQGVKLEELG